MTVDTETDNIEAFDLVTEALTNIDAYQQSRDENLLKVANDSLSQAVELDHDYFKARYFQAMVTYLRSKPNHTPADSDAAIAEFRRLLDSVIAKTTAWELQYNLAAALFQDQQLTEAIKLFEITIEESGKDPEVYLLSRAGVALAYATRAAERQTENQRHDLREFEEHYRYIRKELSLIGFKQIRSLFRDKPIDKKVKRKVKEIIKLARARANHV